jgi:nitroreductase
MDRTSLAKAVRQPKAAAVAGLVFGLILTTVLLLLQSVAPQTTSELGSWAEDQSRRDSIVAALALIPFAGIAFLWFVAVVRSELGRLGDRFFETVFLASGLLFVAMLFAAAAVLSALLSLVDIGFPMVPVTEANAWALASALMGQFGTRMAAVFALTVSTAGRLAGTLPRAVAFLGYVCGILLLLTPPVPRWAQFLFPIWVITLSLVVLLRRPKPVEP